MKALQKQIAIFLVFCIVSTLLRGQKKTTISERALDFSDSLMRSEMASFTIKESSINKSDSFAKSTLTEIPISSCSEKEVHLYLGTLTSSISTFIHLYFKGEVPNKRLDSIFLVTHSHFWVKFPHSAFEGLFQSNICKFNKGGKKSKFYSQYYKAFYSLDKRRLYIYMIGGNDLGKYEVTWVIVNDKFCTRIFDCIQ